jgi:hypothetical protein
MKLTAAFPPRVSLIAPRPTAPGLLPALALLLALALPLGASSPNSGILTIVPTARTGAGQGPTAIALMQQADYVCAMVEITSRKKAPGRDLAGQVADIRQTVQLVTAAVEKSPSLSLHNGPVRFAGNMPGAQGRGAYSISSVADGIVSFVNGTAPTTRSLLVLCKLNPAQDDTFDALLALNNLISAIQPPAQTEARIQAVALAVEAPERQREQLLHLIRDGADAMRKTFTASRLTIEGLENPVLVRQVSDTQVELYIDYKLAVSQ